MKQNKRDADGGIMLSCVYDFTFFLVTFSLEKPKILLLEIKCCCYRHISKKKNKNP